LRSRSRSSRSHRRYVAWFGNRRALAVLESLQPDVIASLRHRPCGNERRGSLSLPELHAAHQRAAQRRLRRRGAARSTSSRPPVGRLSRRLLPIWRAGSRRLCGTTPEHLRAVAEAMKGVASAPRATAATSVAASAFSAVSLEADAQPVIIAGDDSPPPASKPFRRHGARGRLDGILTLQAVSGEGSQMLDLCCAIVGRRGWLYMNAVTRDDCHPFPRHFGWIQPKPSS